MVLMILPYRFTAACSGLCHLCIQNPDVELDSRQAALVLMMKIALILLVVLVSLCFAAQRGVSTEVGYDGYEVLPSHKRMYCN